MQYRGETMTEIGRVLDISGSVIGDALKHDTLQAYREVRRAAAIKWLHKKNGKEPKQTPMPLNKDDSTRYERLIDMQKRFADLLSDFIVEEVLMANQDMKQKVTVLESEKKMLQQENEVLLNRIEELEQPNIASSLHERLQQIQKTVQQAQPQLPSGEPKTEEGAIEERIQKL
jgi:hypothetical protein